MSQTTILGAGFGGIATTYELRRLLGSEHEIVLIDRSDSFLMGLRKLWALVGIDSLDHGQRPLAELGRLGINLVQADVQAIDAGSERFRQAGASSRPTSWSSLSERILDLTS